MIFPVMYAIYAIAKESQFSGCNGVPSWDLCDTCVQRSKELGEQIILAKLQILLIFLFFGEGIFLLVGVGGFNATRRYITILETA